MATRLATLILLIVGICEPVGVLLSWPRLRALGRISSASNAPLVFNQVGGIEFWARREDSRTGHGLSWQAALAVSALLFSALDTGCNGVNGPPLHEKEGLEQRAELPIEINRGLVVVRGVSSVDRRPLRFVLDTGSSSVVRKDVAVERRFAADPSAAAGTGVDAHGVKIAFAPILIPVLMFDGIVFEEVPAVSLNSDIFDRYCPPVDGWLGTRGPGGLSGILERVVVGIDYDAGVVRLMTSRGSRPSNPIVLPLRDYVLTEGGTKRRTSQWWVQIRVSRKFVWAEFDTGAAGISEMSLGFFKSLGRDVGERGVLEDLGPPSIAASGAGGIRNSWVTMVDGVQFGDVDLGKIPFRIIERLDPGGPDVRINHALISRFNIVLDYRSGEVVLEERTGLPSVREILTEVGVKDEGGKILVSKLLENGAAERSGLRLGDHVTEVEGVGLLGGGAKAVCRFHQSLLTASSNVIDVRVVRDGVESRIAMPVHERIR